mmetsp:Transcript_1282/g.1625  ORF Transcript_1282/g.1625 Transcript_1282/m.1625 type:complete len:358 (+) Transcript_1282:26-1099(+)
MTFTPLYEYAVSWAQTHVTIDIYNNFWYLDSNSGVLIISENGTIGESYDPRQASYIDVGNNVNPATDLSLNSNLVINIKTSTSTSTSSSTNQEETFMIFSSSNFLYAYEIYSNSLYDLKTFQGSSSWIACQNQDDQQETPQIIFDDGSIPSTYPISIKALTTACPLNGYQWEVEFLGSQFFSEKDMSIYATTGMGGMTSCTESHYIDQMCNTVGHLPPYLCTRDIKEKAVSYLGAAAGFANLIYVILILLGSAVLSFLWPLKELQQERQLDEKEQVFLGSGDVAFSPMSTHQLGNGSGGGGEYYSNEEVIMKLHRQDEVIATLSAKVKTQEQELSAIRHRSLSEVSSSKYRRSSVAF